MLSRIIASTRQHVILHSASCDRGKHSRASVYTDIKLVNALKNISSNMETEHLYSGPQNTVMLGMPIIVFYEQFTTVLSVKSLLQDISNCQRSITLVMNKEVFDLNLFDVAPLLFPC